MIYDLGGGTFDVTVARITPDEIVILSTAGDHDLGGKNWDDRIATYLAERFAAETGFDPLDDPVALNEVLVRSEQAKWALSERTSTRITLQLGTERRSFELPRSEFEAMTFPLMDRTRRLTEEALGEANLELAPARRRALGRRLDADADGPRATSPRWPASPRVPASTSMKSSRWGRPSRRRSRSARTSPTPCRGSRSRPPARGPPQEAGMPSRRVTDVMSHSLGTIAVSPDGSDYVNDIVIRRNVPIPARNTKSYMHETHGGSQYVIGSEGST